MTATRAGSYTVTLTTSNSCGSSQATIYVTVEGCGGFFFSAYPNPTSESLTIEKTEDTSNNSKAKDVEKKGFKESNHKFKLYDFQGELVRSGQLKKMTKINVSSLKKGTYILKINVNGNIETHQIIVK
jgi:PKD repeat protein